MLSEKFTFMVKTSLQTFWQFLTFIVFSVAVLPFVRLTRSSQQPWVIGGHRGRLYADNAGTLHRWITENTEQEIIWISSNPEISQRLQREGHLVLKRGTWTARMAIVRAPVLMYSHGEDDLDFFLLAWRRFLGTRFYIHHCLSHLKGAEYFRNDVVNWGRVRHLLFRVLHTHADWILASSEREKQHLKRSFPYQNHKIRIGSGAHLDFFMAHRDHQPTNTIVYFPTFRDIAPLALQLQEHIQHLLDSKELMAWLEEEDLELQICHHINSMPWQESPSHPRVRFINPGQILSAMVSCQLFISDYSGLIADYLSWDKPIIFFPFDDAEYLKIRKLYIPLEELDAGPIVRDVSGLVELLTSNRWKDATPYAAKRQYWQEEFFPMLYPGYAQRSYEVIRSLTSEPDNVIASS